MCLLYFSTSEQFSKPLYFSIEELWPEACGRDAARSVLAESQAHERIDLLFDGFVVLEPLQQMLGDAAFADTYKRERKTRFDLLPMLTLCRVPLPEGYSAHNTIVNTKSIRLHQQGRLLM